MSGQLYHTKLIGKLGWVDAFLVTPSNHRVHHASNRQYLDRNFGGTTVIWDRVFGTYAPEVETPVYGLTHAFDAVRRSRSWPAGTRSSRCDVRSASGWRDRGRLCMGPPA